MCCSMSILLVIVFGNRHRPRQQCRQSGRPARSRPQPSRWPVPVPAGDLHPGHRADGPPPARYRPVRLVLSAGAGALCRQPDRLRVHAHPIAEARQQMGAGALRRQDLASAFGQTGERVGRQAQKYLLAVALRAEPVVEAQRAFVPVLGREVDAADAVWRCNGRPGSAASPSPSPAERKSARTNRSLRNSSRCRSMPGWAMATEARPATIAVAVSQREMRIGRAFVGEPALRRSQRRLSGKRRLAVVHRHFAQDQRKVAGVRRPRPAERGRHQSMIPKSGNRFSDKIMI